MECNIDGHQWQAAGRVELIWDEILHDLLYMIGIMKKAPEKGITTINEKEKYTLQLFVYGSRRIVIELDMMNLIYMSYSQVGLNDTFWMLILHFILQISEHIPVSYF